MKRLMLGICIIVGIFIMVGLSGCKIISETPDPDKIVEMKPGDNMLFKVYGPLNTLSSMCFWSIKKDYISTQKDINNGKNEFELNLTPDFDIANKLTIICEYKTLRYKYPCGQDHCIGYWVWETVDSRKWEVVVKPDSDTVITGDYIIENDADLQLLTGYTTITGSLVIGPEIRTLQGLESLTTIGGSIMIPDNRFIEDLSALKSISSIGGLWIYGSVLKSLTGLEDVTSLKADLELYSNSTLTGLYGLDNVTSIDGELDVIGNSALAGLSSLARLTSVGNGLWINKNNVLTVLGMAGLQSVDGIFNISDNPSLCSSLADELMGQVHITDGLIYRNKDCSGS